MLSGNVLMAYLSNNCTTTCFGYALETNFAASDAKIPSDFPKLDMELFWDESIIFNLFR